MFVTMAVVLVIRWPIGQQLHVRELAFIKFESRELQDWQWIRYVCSSSKVYSRLGGDLEEHALNPVVLGK